MAEPYRCDITAFLDEVSTCILRLRSRPVIVLENFNTHRVANQHMRAHGFGMGLDLRLLKRGATSICVG